MHQVSPPFLFYFAWNILYTQPKMLLSIQLDMLVKGSCHHSFPCAAPHLKLNPPKTRNKNPCYHLAILLKMRSFKIRLGVMG